MRRSWRIMGLVLAPLVLLGVWSMRSRAGEGAATMIATPAEAAAQAVATAIATPADAAAQAAAFAGFPETAITSVEQRTVSDPTNPFWDVQDMLVWEVVFDGISLTVPQPDGEPAPTNPNLHSLTVWLDPETGAPVKIATPRPVEGGLTLMISGETKRLSSLTLDPIFTMSPVPPEKPLSVAAVAEREQQECTLSAKEIVAYYGLFTYRRGPETLIAEKPFWFVYYAGVRRAFPSLGGLNLQGGDQQRGPEYASEEMVVIDATSGKNRFEFLSGRPD